MGTGCSGGPANAPLVFVCLLIVCFHSASGECRVQLCSRQYTSALEEERVAQGANARYCALLRSYAACVRATARACRGDLAYHTVQSLVRRWTAKYACDADKHPQATAPAAPRPRPPRPPHPAECAAYRGADPAAHCALFGDPHLRTFYDELQTCAVPGAWPLLDNPHLAVQVTNEPVGGGAPATAITKVTVIVRHHSPCAVEKTYEAQTDFLPGAFADGSRSSGPGVRILEKDPGRHVEIHLRYIGTRLHIRQVGRYLTFAVKMPSSIAVQGTEEDTLELCVRGCPRRERIDFERLLREDSEAKREAMAACRALNITDFYLEACVFDLLTTGDASFSAAAKDAMLDSGFTPGANSSASIERSVGEVASFAPNSEASLLGMLLVCLLIYLHLDANR